MYISLYQAVTKF